MPADREVLRGGAEPAVAGGLRAHARRHERARPRTYARVREKALRGSRLPLVRSRQRAELRPASTRWSMSRSALRSFVESGERMLSSVLRSASVSAARFVAFHITGSTRIARLSFV